MHAERELAEAMSEARAAEYRAVAEQARSAGVDEGARRNAVRAGCAASSARSAGATTSPHRNAPQARNAVDELAASGEHEEATR